MNDTQWITNVMEGCGFVEEPAPDAETRRDVSQARIKYTNSQKGATLKGAGWDMTYEEFCELWSGRWFHAGARSGSISLKRLDLRLPFSKENCIVGTERERRDLTNLLNYIFK